MRNVTVIGSIVVVSALIGFAGMYTMREQRRAIQQYLECKHRLHSLSFLVEAFKGRHHRLPGSLQELTDENSPMSLPRCPCSPEENYVLETASGSYTILCKGQKHKSAGKEPDTPWFTSKKGLIYD